ncbi:MAG: LemA family protein [Flavobacteriales bacterium]
MAYEKTGKGGFNIRQWIVPGILGLAVIFGITTYNGLVGLDEDSDTAWEGVENAYETKFRLIPNLVRSVERYAEFEQETLVLVTEARASAFNGDGSAKDFETGDVEGLQRADRSVGIAMRGMLGYQERYPELKANEGFRNLEAQLTESEYMIKNERDRYNLAVNAYNKKRRRFPQNLFAGMLGFDQKDGFEASEDAKRNDYDINDHLRNDE